MTAEEAGKAYAELLASRQIPRAAHGGFFGADRSLFTTAAPTAERRRVAAPAPALAAGFAPIAGGGSALRDSRVAAPGARGLAVATAAPAAPVARGAPVADEGVSFGTPYSNLATPEGRAEAQRVANETTNQLLGNYLTGKPGTVGGLNPADLAAYQAAGIRSPAEQLAAIAATPGAGIIGTPTAQGTVQYSAAPGTPGATSGFQGAVGTTTSPYYSPPPKPLAHGGFTESNMVMTGDAKPGSDKPNEELVIDLPNDMGMMVIPKDRLIGKRKRMPKAPMPMGGERKGSQRGGVPYAAHGGLFGFDIPQLPAPEAMTEAGIKSLEQSVRPPAINTILGGGIAQSPRFGFELFTPQQIRSLTPETREALGTTLATQFNETPENVEFAMQQRFGPKRARGRAGQVAGFA